jgi:hypothetical protein
MLKSTTRISTANISVRMHSIAKNYGLTTVGQLHKFLSKCPPNANVCFNVSHMRAQLALKMLNSEINSHPTGY